MCISYITLISLSLSLSADRSWLRTASQACAAPSGLWVALSSFISFSNYIIITDNCIMIIIMFITIIGFTTGRPVKVGGRVPPYYRGGGEFRHASPHRRGITPQVPRGTLDRSVFASSLLGSDYSLTNYKFRIERDLF